MVSGSHRLVSEQIPAQRLGFEMAVGVGDERPHRTENPRQTGERPLGELGKLRVITRGKVFPDLADLHVDKVIVVDQPFRRRRHMMPFLDRLCDRAVALEQDRGIFGKAARQRLPPDPLRRYGLRGREACRVLFESLDAEELAAHWGRIPAQCGCGDFEHTADDHCPGRLRDRRVEAISTAKQAASVLRRSGMRTGQERGTFALATSIRWGFTPNFRVRSAALLDLRARQGAILPRSHDRRVHMIFAHDTLHGNCAVAVASNSHRHVRPRDRLSAAPSDQLYGRSPASHQDRKGP